MLGADPQVLPDGVHLGANVFPQDVGGPRGGREQPSQDGPEDRDVQVQKSACSPTSPEMLHSGLHSQHRAEASSLPPPTPS